MKAQGRHPLTAGKRAPAGGPKATGGGWTASFDRFFSLLDGDLDGTRSSKLRSFEIVLLMITLTEYWARVMRSSGGLSWENAIPALIASALCAAALLDRWRRPAFLGLALTHIALIAADFPARGNHAYLEVYFYLLAAFLDHDRDEDGVLYLRAVRWLVCIIFFWAGVQKLVQGYYLQGQYLAFAVKDESYQLILRPLLDAEEYARLMALRGGEGAGPYLVSSPLLLLASNLVWVGEIALAPLFLIRATRPWAVAGAIALVVAIEIGARELFFGFVYVNATLLMLAGDVHRRLIVPAAVILSALLLVSFGVLPEMKFY